MPTSVKSSQQNHHRSHEITYQAIKIPRFSYACLQVISDPPAISKSQLDPLTVRSYIGSALNQFLGLTGSAISIDVLKIEGSECWIRVPREDLSLVIAAVGGWAGASAGDGRVGWKVKSSGNWLSVLVAEGQACQVWG
ncbi:uncharacterized protein RCO7_14861 [Rhynchosporium graminicola]|uniref:Ribonucleases P/MRP subunit Pop8-like domain-containing protein n=2 Tax=Rhynchosporium TaxID=38037 RepID=A0A1E1MAQ8_RHYSE|nr:uncharacterized protein RCO7_14861 [Rhynchosporium commune]CZT46177.1 uncharacterized protein RSE6_06573 [Rhynchosporium secalis]